MDAVSLPVIPVRLDIEQRLDGIFLLLARVIPSTPRMIIDINIPNTMLDLTHHPGLVQLISAAPTVLLNGSIEIGEEVIVHWLHRPITIGNKIVLDVLSKQFSEQEGIQLIDRIKKVNYTFLAFCIN